MPILSHQTRKADEELLLVAPLLLRLTCSSKRLVRPLSTRWDATKYSTIHKNIRFSDGLEEEAATIHLVGALPLSATGAVQLLRFF